MRLGFQVPSAVFESDTRSAGCADCSGTAGAIAGDGWHEDGAARDDVSKGKGFLAVLTGVDYAGSFGRGIARDHASDFSPGADAGHAAN